MELAAVTGIRVRRIRTGRFTTLLASAADSRYNQGYPQEDPCEEVPPSS